jgi:hypothetical protein
MADRYQFPLFYTIPGFRLRLVLIGEQEVDGRWVEHDTTELAQFSPLDGDGAVRQPCQETPHFGEDVYSYQTSLQGSTSTPT